MKPVHAYLSGILDPPYTIGHDPRARAVAAVDRERQRIIREMQMYTWPTTLNGVDLLDAQRVAYEDAGRFFDRLDRQQVMALRDGVAQTFDRLVK